MSQSLTENRLAQEYFDLIESCAKNKIDLEIPNGSATHALHLLRQFFKYSKKRVYIFSGLLYDKIFDDSELIELTKKFLHEAGHQMIIAFSKEEVTPDIIKSRLFMREIANDPERKGNVLLYDARFASSINHFAIMDDKAYRFELDHDKSIAVANFSDKNTVAKLDAIFDNVIKMATPIPI